MADDLVLVTGSAGRIGQAVVRELARRGQAVRGFDMVPTPGPGDHHVGDLASFSDVNRAMVGVTRLVHLAATPDDDDFMTRLLPNNIVGVYNVLESAREHGVQRAVLASTGQVVWWQRMRNEIPIGVDVQPTPRGWYAAAKCFLEAAGRSFAEAHDRSVIVARLGWCPRTREQAAEIRASLWAQEVYLSPGDAGRFFADAALAPTTFRFAVLYAASKPVQQATYDLEPTRQLIGFTPRDQWPMGVEDML
ncbi:MAG: NAD(P)-dependent oxidoreductase [Gemmataceae bacterium]